MDYSVNECESTLCMEKQEENVNLLFLRETQNYHCKMSIVKKKVKNTFLKEREH